MLGSPRRHFRVVDSTNRVARDLAAAGAPHGTLVTADTQSAGRGRQGRAWSSRPGSSLLMSLVIRDPSPILSLAAGVAVAETVEAASHGGERVTIKWPNDVLVDGRKIAGILVEGRPQEQWAVLGIGLNVAVRADEFPPELRDRAATMGLQADDREHVLTTLLARLTTHLATSDEQTLAALGGRDHLQGLAITWDGPGGTRGGTGAGIDGAGRLRVELSDGSVALLDAGEVHIGSLGSAGRR
jgi:BirA family transcriptional regulator, biotin operon repressor / biotin---[acetyl-CoA-carboxylase] ligase